jgi:hypothetical protein
MQRRARTENVGFGATSNEAGYLRLLSKLELAVLQIINRTSDARVCGETLLYIRESSPDLVQRHIARSLDVKRTIPDNDVGTTHSSPYWQMMSEEPSMRFAVSFA